LLSGKSSPPVNGQALFFVLSEPVCSYKNIFRRYLP